MKGVKIDLLDQFFLLYKEFDTFLKGIESKPSPTNAFQ